MIKSYKKKNTDLNTYLVILSILPQMDYLPIYFCLNGVHLAEFPTLCSRNEKCVDDPKLSRYKLQKVQSPTSVLFGESLIVIIKHAELGTLEFCFFIIQGLCRRDAGII